jgi:hypothetical protein
VRNDPVRIRLELERAERQIKRLGHKSRSCHGLGLDQLGETFDEARETIVILKKRIEELRSEDKKEG